MGVVQDALAHFGGNLTPPRAFALAGHAFAIKVREDSCSSGPYCWNHERLFKLLADNLGLRMLPIGNAPVGAPATVKAALEKRVRNALDANALCSVRHLDSGWRWARTLTASAWRSRGVTSRRRRGASPSVAGEDVRAHRRRRSFS